ncbi:uncharacterized protein E6C27_scaffold21G005240 [Cucumis melo var. makuwa]|uniref:Uncharacterized protein n=1 Tax=Cucumis melo var. makuwa TaxID=1194695 RepID=A0A5A7VE85_CUCMM|nr:uncharacterized protein E6C27_scaffold21G005240 [Cucumis melo var. makuwa]
MEVGRHFLHEGKEKKGNPKNPDPLRRRCHVAAALFVRSSSGVDRKPSYSSSPSPTVGRCCYLAVELEPTLVVAAVRPSVSSTVVESQSPAVTHAVASRAPSVEVRKAKLASQPLQPSRARASEPGRLRQARVPVLRLTCCNLDLGTSLLGKRDFTVRIRLSKSPGRGRGKSKGKLVNDQK